MPYSFNTSKQKIDFDVLWCYACGVVVWDGLLVYLLFQLFPILSSTFSETCKDGLLSTVRQILEQLLIH